MYLYCRPNPGFTKQLELFEAMGNHVNPYHAEYRQYRLSLFATQMLNCECFELIVIISAVKLYILLYKYRASVSSFPVLNSLVILVMLKWLYINS